MAAQNAAEQASIPQRARDAAAYVEKNGNAPPGFRGGRTFENDGHAGGQFLPKIDKNGNSISYREWDVNPYTKGVNRGGERIVTGGGKAYYTNDHYDTFTEIK